MTPTIEQLAEAIARDTHRHHTFALRAARVAMDMLAPVGGHEAGVERAVEALNSRGTDDFESARAIIAAYKGETP